MGYKPRYKEGYFPVPPMDSLQDIRTEMVQLLQQVGIQVEVHHHEVATAGQCEIDMRFDTLTNVRIPAYSRSEKAKRIEFRPPDPSCNGYLAFAAMMMAGLDGIQSKIMPPDPMDKDLYDLPAEDMAKIQSTPGSLEEVLSALEKDHDFLLKGDVFTPDVIETWIEYKRSREVDAIRLRPHPYEFALYFDI